jgi:hypothetical protein
VVIAETTGRLFVQAAQAVVARHQAFFGLTPCSHQHENREQEVACMQARVMSALYNASVAVALMDEKGSHVGVAASCNASDGAEMVKALCTVISEFGRPTDCEKCAANYDLLRQALAILSNAGGKC